MISVACFLSCDNFTLALHYNKWYTQVCAEAKRLNLSGEVKVTHFVRRYRSGAICRHSVDRVFVRA